MLWHLQTGRLLWCIQELCCNASIMVSLVMHSRCRLLSIIAVAGCSASNWKNRPCIGILKAAHAAMLLQPAYLLLVSIACNMMPEALSQHVCFVSVFDCQHSLNEVHYTQLSSLRRLFYLSFKSIPKLAACDCKYDAIGPKSVRIQS